MSVYFSKIALKWKEGKWQNESNSYPGTCNWSLHPQVYLSLINTPFTRHVKVYTLSLFTFRALAGDPTWIREVPFSGHRSLIGLPYLCKPKNGQLYPRIQKVTCFINLLFFQIVIQSVNNTPASRWIPAMDFRLQPLVDEFQQWILLSLLDANDAIYLLT